MQDFYSTKEYRKKQSILTKQNWQKGVFDFLYKDKREERICKRLNCKKKFEVLRSSHKIYCSKSCSAIVNNKKRGRLPIEVKLKIAQSLMGRNNPFKGVIKVPRIEVVCNNLVCKKKFFTKKWRNRKFCSKNCVMSVVGKKPTSPKAARGKSGIRKDINNNIYFYSRWEANFARLLNLLNIEWIFQAKTFDLRTQTYTPDFYLPKYDIWIEIKNFLSDYSKNRDDKFRKLYPDKNLILILKEDYLKLQEKFASKIKNWEYS